jgi:hypothetical protein
MDWGIGIEINIPKDNQIFYTNLYQMNGNLISGFVDEWECWWVFEVDE